MNNIIDYLDSEICQMEIRKMLSDGKYKKEKYEYAIRLLNHIKGKIEEGDFE